MKIFGFDLSRKASNYDLNGNRFYAEYIINREIGSIDQFKVPAAACAGMRIAEGVAAMRPLHGKESVDKEGRLIHKPDPLSAVSMLFRDRPNDYMTPTELLENLTLHAVFEGAGRAYIDRTYRGRIREIVPAHGLTPRKDTVTGRVTYSGQVDGHGFLEGIKRRDVIEITNPRWIDIEGLDINYELRDVLKLALSLQRRQLDDAAEKSVRGYITFADAIGKEPADMVQEALDGKGLKAPVFDRGGQFKTMQPSAADMQLLETRRFAIQEVARAFGIHPLLLGHDGAGQSLTRVQDVIDYHVTITLGSWVRRWEDALRFSLCEAGEYINMDEMQFYRMDLARKAEYAAKALGGNTGWSTINRVAYGIFGENPIDGGDELQGAGNETPI